SCIKLVFKYCARNDLIAVDPTTNIDLDDDLGLAFNTARERTLTDDEIRVIWNQALTLGYPYGSVLCLLLLTGARLREIAECSYGELSIDKATLTIGTQRMKMKLPHIIPLCDTARQIFESVPKLVRPRGDYIFSASLGAGPITG